MKGQQDRDDEGDRQQDPGHRFSKDRPEIAKVLCGLLPEPVQQGHQAGDTRSRTYELQEGDHKKLGQIGCSGLAGVVLQIAVDEEADRRIKREVGRHAGIPVGIQRQPALKKKKDKSIHEPYQVDRQHGFQKFLPVHLLGGVDAAKFKNEPFHRMHKIQDGPIAPIDVGNILSKWESQEHGYQEGRRHAGYFGIHDKSFGVKISPVLSARTGGRRKPRWTI